jgi:Ni/Co efflux regulator RcnB
MRFWKHFAQGMAVAALAFAGAAAGAAPKRPASAPAAAPEPAPEPAPGRTMGYGVKLGGFFTAQHKQVARRSFAQYFARTKECPKDMERSGKTCKALVQGHYWAVGQPLQKAVETYPVPDPVKAQLPAPPEGYEYVRAGEDILLVSKGIHLVVDMMENVTS